MDLTIFQDIGVVLYIFGLFQLNEFPHTIVILLKNFTGTHCLKHLQIANNIWFTYDVPVPVPYR